MNKVLFFVAGFLVFSGCSSAPRDGFANEQPGIRAVVEAEPHQIGPEVVFTDVFGNYMNVTQVTFVTDANISVPLEQRDSRTWAGHLNLDQYKQLVGRNEGGRVNGALLIRSVNAKRLSDLKREPVAILIREEPSSQTISQNRYNFRGESHRYN